MEDLDEFIIEHVTRTVSELKIHDNDGVYKSKILCRDFWEDLDGVHQLIGKHIRLLANNNRLPIVYVGKDDANAALYRLK